jgi:estrogen-related receptor beta like 1
MCRSFPPVGRLFFAMPNSVETMFPYFASLCAWLLKEAGVSFTEWSEFDDMTQTCSAILAHAKAQGFEDAQASPFRLSQCAPEPVCDVLDFLATRALMARGFDTPTPSYAAASRSEEAHVDSRAEADGSGDIGEDVPEETLLADPLAAHGAGSSTGGLKAGLSAAASGTSASVSAAAALRQSAEDRQLLRSSVSHEQWALHLEAVLPRLRVKLEGAVKEWRAHLDEALRQRQTLAQDVPEACATLDRLSKQLAGHAERIRAREQQINEDLNGDPQGLGAQLRARRGALRELEGEHERLTGAVSELGSHLGVQTERVNQVKAQTAERNNAMTDTAPLRQLQTSLRQLKQEVDQMELRIGIVNQTLLTAKLKALARKSREDAEARARSASKLRAGGALTLTRKPEIK